MQIPFGTIGSTAAALIAGLTLATHFTDPTEEEKKIQVDAEQGAEELGRLYKQETIEGILDFAGEPIIQSKKQIWEEICKKSPIPPPIKDKEAQKIFIAMHIWCNGSNASGKKPKGLLNSKPDMLRYFKEYMELSDMKPAFKSAAFAPLLETPEKYHYLFMQPHLLAIQRSEREEFHKHYPKFQETLMKFAKADREPKSDQEKNLQVVFNTYTGTQSTNKNLSLSASRVLNKLEKLGLSFSNKEGKTILQQYTDNLCSKQQGGKELYQDRATIENCCDIGDLLTGFNQYEINTPAKYRHHNDTLGLSESIQRPFDQFTLKESLHAPLE